MRIFLTGATGYLGGVLAPRLAAAGHEVRALLRPGRDPQALVQAGVTPFVGDIEERASMREAMSGADWVIHAAAYVKLEGSQEEMEKANVQGSENVASLAHKLGVGRLLSVSSMAYFGGSPEDGSLANEDTPPSKPFPSLYSATKHAGQLRIQHWAQKGLRVNTVYPSLIYGPPGKNVGSNPLIKAIARERFPAVVGAGKKTSWIYIDDVVEAMLAILERAPVGRDYVLAGQTLTVKEMIAEVCRASGARPPRLALSVGTARVLMGLARPALRLFGRTPPLSPGQLSSLARNWAFDDARARRELGWQPRTLAEGLRPTLAYLLA